jgi:hypothetical protein
MKATRDNWLIQIEITNMCNFRCANCTRFIGYHNKPYFMDLATIEKAIDSLEGFPGGVGIMGGEPLMHPDFSMICELVRKKVPLEKRFLWTSGYKWEKYKKIVRKTFAENIYYNDHQGDTQKHQPILIAIKDILDDRDFIKELIDNCWIQKMWSPSINPKGGFFCEVAAAMDLLFEGKGGYSLEKGWWDKTPEDFKEQIERYCYYCSAAVPLPSISNKEDKDYVSISNYCRLQKIKSSKFMDKRINLFDKKYSKKRIMELAKDWHPWEYLGDEKRKSFYFLYGLVDGFLVSRGKSLRKKKKKLKKYLATKFKK